MTVRNLVGLVHNPQLPASARLVKALVESLGLRGRCWVSPADDIGQTGERLEETALVIIAGGDGTILRTVRVTAHFEIPIVGVNMGRVGFMTELSVEEAPDKLPAYLDGEFRVEERMMLQVSVTGESGESAEPTLHALNDVVLGRGSTARLLDIDATVGGVPLTTYRADAVILSTATGSTGYSLSAGGSIIHPEAEVMQLQPVAAHTGLRDGLILPGDSVVELSARDSDQAMLSVDAVSEMTLGVDSGVSIQRSPLVARFLRAKPPDGFYAALPRRLGLK